MVKDLAEGGFTVADEHLVPYLRALYESEGIFAEPSACAAFAGPAHFSEAAEDILGDLPQENVTHLVWATGGTLVPQSV